jgi:hypothetical protein
MVYLFSATLIRVIAAVITSWEIGSIQMEPLWKVLPVIVTEAFQNSFPEVEIKVE